MTFAVVTNCFDEPDLLPQFMRHYEAQGADEILVAFDRSPELDDQLHRITRSEMRIAYTGLVDYVIMPDIDELIVAKSGRTIAEELAGHTEEVLGCEGWLMFPAEDEMPYTPHLPLTEQRKHGVLEPQYGKPIVIRPASMMIHGNGFHELLGQPKPTVEPFRLLHYFACDHAIYIRRRLRQSRRLGIKAYRSGCGMHNYKLTETDFEARWEDMRKMDLVKVLPWTSAHPSNSE